MIKTSKEDKQREFFLQRKSENPPPKPPQPSVALRSQDYRMITSMAPKEKPKLHLDIDLEDEPPKKKKKPNNEPNKSM